MLRPASSLAICLVTFALIAPPARAQTGDPNELTPETIIFSMPLEPGEPPLEATFQQLMEIYKVPGFSIALIDQDRIAWARGYGVTEAGSNTPVTDKTLFQAASISKPVTAMAALALVEQGKLSLDEDVNKKLVGWKVPDNAFTKKERVTLRRLMSHNAGLTVHGFAGYGAGAPLPTMKQILNGDKPANSPPVRVDIPPGSQCRYSGGGVTIEGLLMSEVTHQPFVELMQKSVLDKAGMSDSTFAQPLPVTLAARAATGTHADGKSVEGKWHVYPELAPDGLWTTPSDLAKLAIEVALSKQGKANHILSEKMTREMLTVQCKEGDGPFGLGFGVGDERAPDLFLHNGANDGFQSTLMMFADSGKGYAAMSNSDSFSHIEPFVRRTLANRYGWVDNAKPRAIDVLVAVESLRGTQVMLKLYEQLKKAGPKIRPPDAETLIVLGYRLLEENRNLEAIEVFQRNVMDYPNDWNAYDSLAEAQAHAGEKAMAIVNYERSLQLNPKSESGIEALKKLR